MDLLADIRNALETRGELRAAFERLPPSHRRQYLRWIKKAKRPRTKRIAGMIERLAAGAWGA